MMPTVSVKPERMREAALKGYATATDLADYLVRKGMPFRDAHEVVGRSVAYAIEQARDLAQLTLKELQQFYPAIEADVFEVLTLDGSVKARKHIGGTAPAAVRAAVATQRRRLNG